MVKATNTLKVRVRPTGSAPFEVEISTFPVRIGRSPASDLRLDDPFVSRHHVELTLVGREVRLTDAGSGNGTFLNGLRTETGMVLKSGDRLRLGNTVLELDQVPGTDATTRPVESPARTGERKPAAVPASFDPRRLAALELQAQLLPAAAPVVSGYELAFGHQPAPEVGADWLDFISLGDRRVLMVACDVSGFGLEAAVLASSVRAALRARAASDAALAPMVEHLNRFLAANSAPNRFVSLLAVLLDPASHRLEVVNAGYARPCVVRGDGEVETVETSGLPLGIRDDARHLAVELELAPGDVLLVASDGLLGAINGTGQELGMGRLLEVAHRYRGALASELQVLVEQEVSAFVGSRTVDDDRALLVLRRVL